MGKHAFGGEWTSDKLEMVRRYLVEYVKILRKNIRAQYFSITYVDAFAGTGHRVDSQNFAATYELFDDIGRAEAGEFCKGSARIALEVEPTFDRYVFIEKQPERVSDLRQLASEFPDRDVKIEEGDCYHVVSRWCENTDWSRNRAVVFLDPYGMQVDWSMLCMIAETKGIDLWLLFPLGVAVNRLLTRSGPPPDQFAGALTRVFGTEAWMDEFCRRDLDLFQQATTEKVATPESVGKFFVDRLKTIFAGVADTPRVLYNSRNSPLYMLCFAAGNAKGAKTAVKIAKHILER